LERSRWELERELSNRRREEERRHHDHRFRDRR
jgi:hypothetical protein